MNQQMKVDDESMKSDERKTTWKEGGEIAQLSSGLVSGSLYHTLRGKSSRGSCTEEYSRGGHKLETSTLSLSSLSCLLSLCPGPREMWVLSWCSCEDRN